MVLAIDAGSRFIKALSGDNDATILNTCFRAHQGDPLGTVMSLIDDIPPLKGLPLVFTGTYGKRLSDAFPGSLGMDEIEGAILAARFYGISCRYIVNVGAGSIRCIELDGRGAFRSYRENGLCAAGTGSFLDEQMRRMGLEYEGLGDLEPGNDPPHIATRCAVFAKSDIIHYQQKGRGAGELWSGLCRGVVQTMLSTLFRGEAPREPVLFIGGIFLNHIVRHWSDEAVDRALFHEQGHLFPALGAMVRHAGGAGRRANLSSAVPSGRTGKAVARTDRPGGVEACPYGVEPSPSEAPVADETLLLKRFRPAPNPVLREYREDGAEIRVYDAVRHGQGVSLGIDVGSTSTKVAVVDAASRDVILDVYRKTGGDPVGAARSCFGSVAKILGARTEVVRAAATGSGRTLVGELMGAHLIVNEISAHHYGASHEEPGVETIIEIGGQDAKYIRAANGMVVDSAMNYVCAAGTGSFIEEQANRLGFDVREIGGAVLGRRAPRTSDRCTVFMEQDIHKLLGEGYGREEVMAGVMYSIAKNYLRRVAGSRPIAGDRVFFQGATARNLGLVAAFESLLDREIVVSPFCHIMGAYGAALLAIDRPMDKERRFRGLSCFDKEIELEYRRCGDCRNRCLITTARVGGEEVSWGYLCGRDGNSRRAGKRGKNYFIGMDFSQGADSNPRLRGAPRAVIGIPRALSMFSYLPLWKTFLEEMGFETADSGASGAGHREQAAGMAVSDFCFPVKLGLAHAAVLADRGGVDAVFFPALVSEKPQENGLPRVFCPYVISYPSLLTGAVGLSIPVIAPSLDFRLERPLLVRELWHSLKNFGVSEKEVGTAFDRALDTLKSLQAQRYREGKAILEAMARRGKPAVVFIGRPYNLHDRVINLGLPEQFRSFGFDIVPFECLLDPDENDSGIHHMYWNYGERILAAAEIIREIPFLYPVYFSNFGCGPDSFVLTRFERAMGGKPYLILELDEHGADTGYLTRVEAFIDVINSNKSAPPKESGDGGVFHGKWQKKGRKLWIPPMHEISAILTAAGFRAWDFDAEALPVEDGAALETGRKGARGGECLPAHTTIGTFLRTMRRIGADPAGQAFFMPTAEGPCRYGQYTLLHRDMLDREGFHQTAIFSPSSVNSYMGMPESLRMYLWDILIAGDMVMKALCRVRPYETVPGEADRTAAAAIRGLEGRIERRAKLVPAAAEAVRDIMAVPVSGAPRPLVGIVGEIYVRCNPFCNNNLIRSIEEQGGEAWLTPISEWILYTSWCERYFSRLYRRGAVHNFLLDLKTKFIFSRMTKFEKALAPLLADRYEPPVERVMELGGAYLPVIFEGEAILTVGRALAFAEQGAALVVNCAPFGCMPGNITNAFMNTVGEKSGVPMVTLFYDGVSDINRIVGIYLNNRDAGESPIIHHAARKAETIAGKVSS